MTQEKTMETFEKLTRENGFTEIGAKSFDGSTIYSRSWKREVEVVWYGKSEETLEIKMWISYGCTKLWIIRNGHIEDKIRDYSSPKRAMNAVGEIVRFAGYAM